MTRNWPVLTTAIALVFFLVTPFGWELIGNILSGDGLSGSIAGGFVLLVVVPIPASTRLPGVAHVAERQGPVQLPSARANHYLGPAQA